MQRNTIICVSHINMPRRAGCRVLVEYPETHEFRLAQVGLTEGVQLRSGQ